ncbi:ABC transporter substrate-binding protein [Chloroflexota bacterium]
MRNVWYSLLVLGLALSLVLSGCKAPAKPAPAPAPAPTPAPTPGPAPAPAPGKPELTREQKLVEAAKKEGEVVFWTYNIRSPEISFKPFKEKYPFIDLKTWDSRGGEILAKLSEETKAGRHNVDVLMLTSEMADAHSLGFLEEYEFPNTKGWPVQPPGNYYKMVWSNGRHVCYNTNLVPPGRVPTTWDDLKDPWYRGKAFCSTSAEDTPLFWAYLWSEDGGKTLNWDRSFKYWGEVIENLQPIVGGGFGGATGRLGGGEFAMMVPNVTSSVLLQMRKGAPIDFAPFPKAPGAGSFIGLAKDAPHPNAAKLFIDLYTTEEALLAYANTLPAYVINPAFGEGAYANKEMKAKGIEHVQLPLEFNTGENLKKSADFWEEKLGVM